MEKLKVLFIAMVSVATMAGCSPKIQERIVYETDTTFIEKEVRVTDTVYKYRTEVRYQTDSVFVLNPENPDQIPEHPDTLYLESNYAYSRAWYRGGKLYGEIQDKDTTLSFRQDSARVTTDIKETNKTTRKEVVTRVIKERYVPWWVYLLWGLSLGLVIFIRTRF